METKARIKIIDQMVRAGKRKILHAREHCDKGGIHTGIDNVIYAIENLEMELKYYGRNQD